MQSAESPRFAEVAVNAPAAGRQTYSYAIPRGLEVLPGQLLWVPFGPQLAQGVVFALVDRPSVEITRDVEEIVDPRPLLSPYRLELARWLSQHYLCPLFDAAALMLPTGVERRVVTWVEMLVDTVPSETHLTAHQKTLLEHLRARRRVPLADLKKLLRRGSASVVVEQLVRKGLVAKVVEREREKVRPRVVSMARLALPIEEAQARLAALGRASPAAELLEALLASPSQSLSEAAAALPRARREALQRLAKLGLVDLGEGEGVMAHLLRPVDETQEALLKLRGLLGPARALRLLAEEPRPVPELRRQAQCTPQALARLEGAGLVETYTLGVRRDPLAGRTFEAGPAPVLTPAQEAVWEQIRAALGESRPGQPTVFLLHGITGSGKTEIYLRALAEVVRRGGQGVVMVPEIALTPQTIGRFAARFPGRVAVLHSQLSDGERFDEWWRIREGGVDVVIGPRSAVFAPASSLRLIVVDEEHEWTYKQQERAPFYHARDVALKLAELTGAVVILGSATPDVVTYYRAETGQYRLLELPERVASDAGSAPNGEGTRAASIHPGLPPVEVVDLRQELRAGNRSIFSRALRDAITVALAAGEQVILFLNRRGTASVVMCRDCGFVVRCKRCEVPLAYHAAEDDLVCHLCNYRTLVPDICPACWSKRVRYLGLGTQKVEEETAKAFPEARLLRWDRDVTRTRGAHEAILEKFANHEADILIGTQMIAKGLDLPKVTLVGVIIADVGLHLPDYRAGERTFQVLTQVAGRAGRGALGGRVIVQTYSPAHYAVAAASHHDYAAFYRQELQFRREQEEPPFTSLVRLIYSGSGAPSAQREAQRMARLLRSQIDAAGLSNMAVLGPAPAFVRRLRNRWRWQLILRGSDPYELLGSLSLPRGWTVDVDPVSLL